MSIDLVGEAPARLENRTVRTVEITNSIKYATIIWWIDSHDLPKRTGRRSDDT